MGAGKLTGAVPLLALLLPFHLWTPLADCKKPNILFIMTDDQDLTLGGFSHMPKTKELLVDEGSELVNMFATTPVCCPSRSSFVTGKYIHNIPMTNNSLAGNCSSKAWQEGAEKENVGKIMSEAGYRTGYLGKYLNRYGEKGAGGTEHVPPGWTYWNTLEGNSRYYNYTLSVNGTAEWHGDNYYNDYLPDLIKNRTRRLLSYPDPRPFFFVVAPPSCHDPTEAAPKYTNRFPNVTAPRTPNYACCNQDKAKFVNIEGGPMDAAFSHASDWQYRRRLETLLSVDDMVADLYGTLKDLGELENTYIFYTSDNGYHLGQFGLSKDKRTLYENDIRLPGVVRGPGIAHNSVVEFPVTMVDFLPTFANIAGLSRRSDYDGITVLEKLHQAGRRPVRPGTDETGAVPPVTTPSIVDGRSFLIEYHGEHDFKDSGACASKASSGPALAAATATSPWGTSPLLNRSEAVKWRPGFNCYIIGPAMRRLPPYYQGPDLCSCQDATWNTYQCVRVMNGTENTIYCSFDYGFQEFYDLNYDPWQRVNLYTHLPKSQRLAQANHLARLSDCKGVECWQFSL